MRFRVKIHAAHSRLRGEGHEGGESFSHFLAAQTIFLLCQHRDGPALGRLISQRSELRGFGKFFQFDAWRGNEFRRLPIAKGDRPGLVQQKHVHVTRSFNGAPARRQNVAAHQTIDAGNANGAQKSADRGRNQADDQR